jgi:hypothetical protein
MYVPLNQFANENENAFIERQLLNHFLKKMGYKLIKGVDRKIYIIGYNDTSVLLFSKKMLENKPMGIMNY